MTRPVVHWAIVRSSFGPSIVAVTTDRPPRWYGRHLDNSPTHGTAGSVISRHATQEEAESRMSVIRGIEEQAILLRKRLSDAQTRLRRLSSSAIERASTGSVPDPLPALDVLWADQPVSLPTLVRLCERWLAEDTNWGDWEKRLAALMKESNR